MSKRTLNSGLYVRSQRSWSLTYPLELGLAPETFEKDLRRKFNSRPYVEPQRSWNPTYLFELRFAPVSLNNSILKC